MKLRSVALGILVAFALTACSVGSLGGLRGSGNIVSETREIGGFGEVAVSGSARVFLTQGDTQSLVVEVDDNLLEHVRAEVEGSTLHLGFTGTVGGFAPSESLTFHLTVRRIRGLELSGSGSIEATDMNIPRLAVDVSGSGKVRLTGKLEEQDIRLSGSGTYDGGNAETETISVRVSGSGNATVWATELLEARLSGSGRVSYYGQPRVSQDISGSGQVKSLGTR